MAKPAEVVKRIDSVRQAYFLTGTNGDQFTDALGSLEGTNTNGSAGHPKVVKAVKLFFEVVDVDLRWMRKNIIEEQFRVEPGEPLQWDLTGPEIELRRFRSRVGVFAVPPVMND